MEAVDDMKCEVWMMAQSRHWSMNGSAEGTGEEMFTSCHRGDTY